MPRGDGTGPMGYGPRTGGAMGPCSGYPAPGYATPAGSYGRGGRVRGAGRGWRLGFRWPQQLPNSWSAHDEVAVLKREEQNLSETLGSLRCRIQELESDKNG